MCFLRATRNIHLTFVTGWCFLCEYKYLERFTKDEALSSQAFLLMQCGTSQQGARTQAGVHSCCKMKLWNIHFWFYQLHWSKPVLQLAGGFFPEWNPFHQNGIFSIQALSVLWFSCLCFTVVMQIPNADMVHLLEQWKINLYREVYSMQPRSK